MHGSVTLAGDEQLVAAERHVYRLAARNHQQFVYGAWESLNHPLGVS